MPLTASRPSHWDKDNNSAMENFNLIQGAFAPAELLQIITEMVEVKIRFHQSKIEAEDNPEDVEMRERRIRQLQEELHQLRQSLMAKDQAVRVKAQVDFNGN